MKVFLGGTVNNSTWRTGVKEQLNINYFDPVVEDWNDAAYELELSERRYCDYLLYVLTPKLTGFYAIAEVTDDSFKRPDKTIYCYLKEDGDATFSESQIAEMERLGEVVVANGGYWLKSLDEIVQFLNKPVKPLENQEERYDAFISFGRQANKSFAVALSNRLSEHDYDVFFDTSDIPLMVENQEYVFDTILRSDNFVYVISPSTVRSEYCKKELEFALQHNKRIIPIDYQELQREAELLDGIIAKKPAIQGPKTDESLDQMIDEICTILETDKEYVHMHSEILFKARKWVVMGRSQADLLYGKERKKAIEWMAQSSDSLKPLQLQREYIHASKKLSVFMLPLLWLHENTKSFTNLKWFDKITLIISLANPIAMLDQLRTLVFSDHPARYAGVSIPMWILFLIIQVTLTFVGIKNKNLGLFISMVLSAIISASVIALVLLNT